MGNQIYILKLITFSSEIAVGRIILTGQIS